MAVLGSSLEEDLIAKVEPVLAGLGYGLRDLRVVGGSGNTTVRVVLERADGGEAIGIDDCSTAHETLGPLFDVWDPIKGAYTLELSSPGEKPSLRLARHFEAALGSMVRVETRDPLPVPPPAKPRRNWEGRLEALDPNGTIRLSDDMGTHELKLDQVKSAQWLREWTLASDKPAPRGPSNKKQKTETKK